MIQTDHLIAVIRTLQLAEDQHRLTGDDVMRHGVNGQAPVVHRSGAGDARSCCARKRAEHAREQREAKTH